MSRSPSTFQNHIRYSEYILISEAAVAHRAALCNSSENSHPNYDSTFSVSDAECFREQGAGNVAAFFFVSVDGL